MRDEGAGLWLTVYKKIKVLLVWSGVVVHGVSAEL